MNTSIAGRYQCLVTWQDGVTLRTAPEIVEVVVGPALVVTSHPAPEIKVHAGEKATLECAVNQVIGVSFQWFFGTEEINDDLILRKKWNREDVDGENKCLLTITNVSLIHIGSYQCHVKGADNKNCLTKESKLEVVNRPRDQLAGFTATRKVALLIGNGDYCTQDKLKAPFRDIERLGKELKMIGFQVMSFYNIRRESMWRSIKMFVDCICPGSYALFYFTGHGFQEGKDTFIMPLERDSIARAVSDDTNAARTASEEELSQRFRDSLDDCFNLQALVDAMEAKSPALTAAIVDSCRIAFKDLHRSVKGYEPQTPKGTTAILHLTSYGLKAFERNDQENGFLVDFLTKKETGLLRSGVSVQKLFQSIQEVVKNNKDLQLHRKTQIPELTLTISEERSLADGFKPMEEEVAAGAAAAAGAAESVASAARLPVDYLDQVEIIFPNVDLSKLQRDRRTNVIVDRPMTNLVTVTVGGNTHTIGGLDTELQDRSSDQPVPGLADNLIITVKPIIGRYFANYPVGDEDSLIFKRNLLPFEFTRADSDVRIPRLDRILSSTESEDSTSLSSRFVAVPRRDK